MRVYLIQIRILRVLFLPGGLTDAGCPGTLYSHYNNRGSLSPQSNYLFKNS